MASNGGERAGAVVRHSDNETSVAGTGAAGTVDTQVKNGGETPQVPKPQPVEFGWDFPFDSPKPTR